MISLDTDDLRLARWDVSRRHRAGEGWTVKLGGQGEPEQSLAATAVAAA